MRDAERKLHDLCLPYIDKSTDSSNWLTSLENSHWLQYINLILRSAVRITQLLSHPFHVLIHCSDGWDRTSQVLFFFFYLFLLIDFIIYFIIYFMIYIKIFIFLYFYFYLNFLLFSLIFIYLLLLFIYLFLFLFII